MKKGQWSRLVTILVVVVTAAVSLSVSPNLTDSASKSLLDIAGDVNESVDMSKVVQASPSAQLSKNVKDYLEDLEKTLTRAAKGERHGDRGCVYALMDANNLAEQNLFIKLYELETDAGKGVRVETRVGAQTKDYFMIPDVELCVIAGQDARGEISENFHKDYFEEDDKPDSHIYNNDANMVIYAYNVGEDFDESYLSVDILPDYKTYLGRVSYGATEDDNGNGNWLFSPEKGKVCFVIGYDTANTETYHEAGMHPKGIYEIFEHDYHEYFWRGNLEPARIDLGGENSYWSSPKVRPDEELCLNPFEGFTCDVSYTPWPICMEPR